MKALKWIGYIIGGLVVILLFAIGTVYAITGSRMSKSYSTTVPMIPIPTDSASIARGEHLAINVGKCQVCHGDNWAGKIVSDDAMFARLTSANLTEGKGGIGGEYTDQDWIRALRYGVGRDGKSLLFMPAEAYTHFNDIDLGQIIAYLRTLPAADMTIEKKRSAGPVSRAVYLLAGFPLIPAAMIDPNMPRPVIAESTNAEYGKYLMESGGCTGCHTENLGGSTGGGMKTPNLTRSGELGKWTEADFMKVLRTGVRPDGRVLSAEMPWPYMKGLTDTELSAMWAYLHAIPPAQVKQ